MDNINVSPQDLLLMIGDQTVQIAVLKNQLQQAQQTIQAQSEQIKWLMPKTVEDPTSDGPGTDEGAKPAAKEPTLIREEELDLGGSEPGTAEIGD